MNDPAPTPPLFPQLDEADRDRLRDSANHLLAHGSILRDEHRTLYDWAQNRTRLLDEWACLLGLRLVWQREERMILALPENPGMLRRLRLDETVVVLALWYDFHVEVSERGIGTGEVQFLVRDFNERLAGKFNRLKLPSESRMRDILRLLDRKNLVRLSGADDLATAKVRVLPTIRFVIPFQGLEDWQQLAARFDQGADSKTTNDDTNPEDSDEPQD